MRKMKISLSIRFIKKLEKTLLKVTMQTIRRETVMLKILEAKLLSICDR